MRDARQKKVLSVLIIGMVILSWRVYAIITTYGPAVAQAEGNAATDAPAPAGVSGGSAWIEPAPESLSAQMALENQPWGRDPFLIASRPAVESKPDVAAPAPSAVQPDPPQVSKFNGVSRSGDRWLAAINGHIYRVGDVYDETYSISEITSNSVTLTKSGWAFEFSLGSQNPSIRQPTERP